MPSPSVRQHRSARRPVTVGGGCDYWSLCAGAAPGASVSQLPHGVLIHTTCFTSLFAQSRYSLRGKEKVQYEVHLLSGGLLQIGWCAPLAELVFSENDGIGDLPLSAAVDGVRGMLWCVDGKAVPALRWEPGDVVGCYVDLSSGQMDFTLNGTRVADITLPTSSTASSLRAAAHASWSDSDATAAAATITSSPLLYVPALSLGPSEACVVNTGETSLRYPRKGYMTLCEHDECCSLRARDHDAIRPDGSLLAPVPLGRSNLRGLVMQLGLAGDALRVPGEPEDPQQTASLQSCATAALGFLADVLRTCADDAFDIVLCLVQWLQVDVTRRWYAFVLTLYLWFSRLYVGDDDQGASSRRVVAGSQSTRQRVQRVFDLLELLLPPEQFGAVPGLLLAVLQHRLSDRSAARKLAFRVTCDLVRVPSFRRQWVHGGALFCSTLLNLFQLFPISASESRWLAQQLENHTVEQALRLSSRAPNPMCKRQLEFQASAFQCVEALFSDVACYAPLTVALSTLSSDLSLAKDAIACTLDARLGGYRATLPLTFSMLSPAAVVGSLAWAVAASLGKEMDADVTKVEAAMGEPSRLGGLACGAVALKWLPPRTFYSLSLSELDSRHPERPDLRVGGSFTSVGAQLEAESMKPLLATPTTNRATRAPSAAASTLRMSRTQAGPREHPSMPRAREESVEEDADDLSSSDSYGAPEDDEVDDEGPARGSAAVSRRSRACMSTVRQQRRTLPTVSTPPTATSRRWNEDSWRQQCAQCAADRRRYLKDAKESAAVPDSAAWATYLNPGHQLNVSQSASMASPTRRDRTPTQGGAEACQADVFRTAILFVHTFTRQPIGLLGSLELLYSLSEQYKLVSAGADTNCAPTRYPSSDKSTSSTDGSSLPDVAMPSSRGGDTRRTAATDTGDGAFARRQSTEDTLRELCIMFRRVEMSRHWAATTDNLGRFVTGMWSVVTYYWARMHLFERRLYATACASTSAALALQDDAEAKSCPPRAFLMLPIELMELCAELPVYATVLEGADFAATMRLPAVSLFQWDAQLRRAVSHSAVRAVLYRATASVFSSSVTMRYVLTERLQRQKQAHERYLESVSPSSRQMEDPFSLYEATFLDGLDAFTTQENFNEASSLNLLFSLSQESCLLPPPRLLEESFWWVAALRQHVELGDHTDTRKGTETITEDHIPAHTDGRAPPGLHDRRMALEADALTLHAAVSAALKTDVLAESTLACISKCNQLLSQFSELLPTSSPSLRRIEDVKSFQVKYMLLRKSLYVLEFLVKVSGAAAQSSSSHSQTVSPTLLQRPVDAIRVSLMDLLTQCVVRLGFVAPDSTQMTASHNHEPSPPSLVSMRSRWSSTTNALSDSTGQTDARTSIVVSHIPPGSISSNVLQPAFCRDADGWWSCASSACTVTGLLAPVFSILSSVLSEHGTDMKANPFFQVATCGDVLVRRSLELLGHQAWWVRHAPPAMAWRREELLPTRSQSVLLALQKNLRDVERSMRYAWAGPTMTPDTLSPSKPAPLTETTLDSGGCCLICQEAPADTRFKPCGHTCCHLCFARYQNTLTVKAASSARRSTQSSQTRDTHSNTQGDEQRGSAVTAVEDECLTVSWLSSSRRSREQATCEPGKCFFCQQTIESVEMLSC